MISFSTGKLRKKKLFWTYKKFAFFVLLKLRKIREQNGRIKLVKPSDEFVISLYFIVVNVAPQTTLVYLR